MSLQESEPVGSGVLQLLVMDRDTPTNGPPFSFHIVSGNEGRHFQVDQGGLLSLAAPLSAKTTARHQLKIQVREASLPSPAVIPPRPAEPEFYSTKESKVC